MTTTTTAERLSARERLLAAADELFYEDGIHTVGIDRIIERAGVAKASLYNTFGSKDELVRAYLTRRHEARQARIEAALTGRSTPRDKILGVFDTQAEYVLLPNYRGCAFLNASAESQPGSVAEVVSAENRAWLRRLFTELAAEVGVPDPERLAERLVILYDGASVGARMDGNPHAVVAAREVAELLVDAANA